jgi:hypothetical protein
LSGFFSLPRFSSRLLYCCFSVLINHFSTSTALFSGSFSLEGAISSEGCEFQNAEYSTSDVPLRMNGGAVREEISPEKEAMDYNASLRVRNR